MAKKGQIFQTYTEEFKIAAVKAYTSFDERKGVSNPLKGRLRTSFASIEEERDDLRAQVDYLKKRYPNLVKEAMSSSKITTN
ncbi:transposase [Paenibacillus sp. PvR052]|nr:hypothetical protein [Paenibacillus sp. PvP091]MBP1168822.1 hypothetical protein [Paenibacillus sp. PvR098]MBP2439850.1 hypothetical protein [Paenibacillus sp. PvP052]